MFPSLATFHRAVGTPSPASTIEAEVRRLRDQVYGKPISDSEWSNCRANWLQPSEITWLREQSARRTERIFSAPPPI